MSSGLKRAFKNYANVQQIKFTAVKVDTSNDGGIVVPGSSNDGPVMGILQESVLPYGTYDYSNGVYNTALNGVAWPATALGDGQRNVGVTLLGESWAIKGATGTIAVGDLLAVSDSTGRLASIGADGLNLSATTANVVGRAITSATSTGQVFKVQVNPQTLKV